jgi:hypothetical protein
MAEEAHTGYGAKLQRGDGQSPENFVSVMGLKTIDGPGIKRDTHDTTDMDGDGWRTFVGGLVDGGEVTFDANLLPGNHTQGQNDGGFLGEFDKTSCDSKRAWRILLPECEGDPEVFVEFDGVVTGNAIKIPMDDIMTFSGTLKVSGRPEIVITT